MTTPELLTLMDRDPRAAYWSQFWQRQTVTPVEALRLAIADGLMSQEEDPGQTAGDTVMTLAAERGLETKVYDLYGCALHHAALADLIVTQIRSLQPLLARPEDQTVNGSTWVSNAYLASSGVRLHRVVVVDRWSVERKEAESHAWFSLGEMAAYQMPMTQTVIVVGQTRDGRHHSPWSKGWLHPRSKNLRLRKRSGEGFGGEWKQIWREEADQISRDKWLDQMREDQVMHDLVFDVELELPCPEVLSKIRHLISKKLCRLQEMKEAPEPNPSQCDWPIPCPFKNACWNFREPCEELGFIRKE